MLVRRYMRDPVRHEVDLRRRKTRRRHDAPLPARCTSSTASRCSPRSPAACRARWCSSAPSAAPTGSSRSSSAKAWSPARSTATCARRAREKALQGLPGADSHAVLVATDVAARGIHVDDVDVVVHFDPPEEHKGYVHRSGPHRRAGREGVVVDVRALGPGARGRAAADAGSACASRSSRSSRTTRASPISATLDAPGTASPGRDRLLTSAAVRQRLRSYDRRMTRRTGTVPIGGESFTTGEWIEVRAPYDDALLGRVPACGPEQVDRRRRAPRRPRSPRAAPAVEARRDPRPRRAARRRARRGARADHRDRSRPSRSRPHGSRRSARSRRSRSPPSRRARSPATWSRWTRARPAKASSRSRCGCRSASSARSARSTSRSTSSRTSSRRRSRPAARWC